MARRMRTHTDYDFKHLEELQRVVSRAITPSLTRRQRGMSTALGLVFLAAAALLAVQQKHWVLVGVCGGLAVYFLVRSIFFYPLTALGVMQTMDKSITGSDYLLEKSHLLVINPKGSTQYPYQDCHRLLETTGTLYFILKNGSGLILDKANLKGGTAADLRAWMEEKCGRTAEWMGRGAREDP